VPRISFEQFLSSSLLGPLGCDQIVCQLDPPARFRREKGKRGFTTAFDGRDIVGSIRSGNRMPQHCPARWMSRENLVFDVVTVFLGWRHAAL